MRQVMARSATSGAPTQSVGAVSLDESLASGGDQPMHLTLHRRLDRLLRSATMWARQTRCRAEQAANQRALVVHLATVRSQVHAVVLGQRRIMFGVAFDRQTRQLLRRSRDRPAAIVTAGDAVEARNLATQVIDLAVCAAHTRAPGNEGDSLPRHAGACPRVTTRPLKDALATRRSPSGAHDVVLLSRVFFPTDTWRRMDHALMLR